jgi:hypothetical protein
MKHKKRTILGGEKYTQTGERNKNEKLK